MSPEPRSPIRLRLRPGLLALAVLSLAVMPTFWTQAPAAGPPPRPPAPVQIGTSFSPWRAEALGLDSRAAFAELLGMHFRVIRLAARWDLVERSGYSELDELMRMAERARQAIVLEVGMKSLGWPEYYLPAGYPTPPDGGDPAAAPSVRSALLGYVEATVLHYRSSPALVGWQVENEPFNSAGPHRWHLDAQTLKAEMSAVRRLDSRPEIVNAFTHFNLLYDRASTPDGFSLQGLLGFGGAGAELSALQAERPGDVLGLDVYTRIGYEFLGQTGVSVADADWAQRAGHWLKIAQSEHKQAWVTEAQAEPWEASHSTLANPTSLRATDIRTTVAALQAAGFETVLLWGSEYWLWREQMGDRSWIVQVRAIMSGPPAARGYSPGAPR